MVYNKLPLQIPMWQKSGTNEGFFRRMVWFSTFYGKISCIAKFAVDTSTPSCKDWKESERIQTQRWIQNIDMVLHPDQNLKVEDYK